VFQDIDVDALLASALEKRLRGRTTIDERDARRLYRYFTAQGFESDRVLAALRQRKARRPVG
jgi:hypothetical protein